MNHIYLLTGKPGIGKMTTIKNVVERIGIERCGGFYTEEICVQNIRVGFRLVTLDGHTGIFAHIKSESSLRIGRYGVNLESLGIATIQRAIETKKIVVLAARAASSCSRATSVFFARPAQTSNGTAETGRTYLHARLGFEHPAMLFQGRIRMGF